MSEGFFLWPCLSTASTDRPSLSLLSTLLLTDFLLFCRYGLDGYGDIPGGQTLVFRLTLVG